MTQFLICEDGNVYSEPRDSMLRCVKFISKNDIRMIEYVNTSLNLPDDVVIDWCLNKASAAEVITKYKGIIVKLLKSHDSGKKKKRLDKGE